MKPVSFSVLGPFEVRVGDEVVEISSYKQRSVLARLVLDANQIVSSDRLIDDIWGEQASKDRQNALWVHLSGLRKALDGAGADSSGLIVTRSPGYLVRIEGDDLDASSFHRLVGEGTALSSTDPAAGSLVLSEALAMWRGNPYEDFAYERWAQAEIARLEESRLAAVEARIDADLQRGLGRHLVGELEGLVRLHPRREHLTGQLMVALYRSGRQSDALRAYATTRERLIEELGIEPGSELRALEESVLMSDPVLEAGGLVGTPGLGLVPGLSVRGYEIREPIGEGSFGVAYRAYQPAVGREVAIKAIRPDRANDPRFIRHFEAEAQVVASLEHPHIVPMYDYWREPDGAYLVMRLMRTGSLADRLDRGPLAADEAATIAAQIGSALESAHRAGVVHGDVKPENILLDEAGNAYLADFSIALDGQDGGASPNAAYCSPSALSGEPLGPADDVYSLAAILRVALGDAAEPVSSLLEDAQQQDESADDAAVFGTLVAAALGDAGIAHVDAGSRNPFKGLRPFAEVDAPNFFGRERLIERLVARMGHVGALDRFVAVVGPSGSGKSSLVKAGLIPTLRSGAVPGSSGWYYAEMLPAPHPFEQLSESLEAVAAQRHDDLLATLTGGDRGLIDAVASVLPDDGSQLVLVIDQFEELFTQVAPDIADRFLAALVEAIGDPRCRVRVIATLRADYYDRPLARRHLGELLRDGTEVVTPMTSDELERAINGPLDGTGVRFESALVGRMIADVVDHPGGLPLLQYALTELFETRQGPSVATEAYHDIGGATGALINRAEGIYNGLSDDSRSAAREVFLRLVNIGELSEDTRRRVLEVELAGAGTGAAVSEVLDSFGRHRLLTFDRDPVSRGPTVEIAHEALGRDWPRFGRWLETSRADLRTVRRLEEAASEWAASDRSDAYLLRSGRLAAAEEYLDTGTVAVSDEVSDLVASSRARQDADIADRRRRRRRVLYGFGAAAVVGVVLAIAALLSQQSAEQSAAEARGRALAASSVNVLDEDSELSLLLALAAANEVEPTVDAVSAIHEALADHRAVLTWTWPADELRAARAFAAIDPAGTRLLVIPDQGGTAIMIDADDGSELWRREFSWDGPGHVELSGPEFMADGRHVVVAVATDSTGSEHGAEVLGVHLLDVDTGASVQVFDGPPCGFRLVGKPGDDVLPVIAADCAGRSDLFGDPRVLMDLRTGDVYGLHVVFPDGVRLELPLWTSLTVSGDGSLAMATNDGDVVTVFACGVRAAEANECPEPGRVVSERLSWGAGWGYLSDDGSRSINGAFSYANIRELTLPFGESPIVGTTEIIGAHDALFLGDDIILIAGWGGIVEAVTADAAESVFTLRSGTGSINRLASTTDDRLIAVSSGDSVRVFDVSPDATFEVAAEEGGEVVVSSFLSGFGSEVMDAWSPSGDFRAVKAATFPWQNVYVRHQPDEKVYASFGPTYRDISELRGVAFSADGRMLAVGWESEVQLIDTATWEVAEVATVDDDPRVRGEGVVFAPTGHLLAVGGRTQSADVVVYDVGTLDVAYTIQGAHDGSMRQIVPTSDGEGFVTVGQDGFIRVWRTVDGVLLHEIPTGGLIAGVELSADERHVIVQMADGRVVAWTFDVDELLAIAASRLTRGFTAAECRAYQLDPCPTLEEMRSG